MGAFSPFGSQAALERYVSEPSPSVNSSSHYAFHRQSFPDASAGNMPIIRTELYAGWWNAASVASSIQSTARQHFTVVSKTTGWGGRQFHVMSRA